MPTPSHRQQKVADLIHRQLAELFRKEIQDPRLITISLTAVSVSSDLKQAKVFFTLLEEQNLQTVQKALDKATNYLRHLLAEVTVFSYVPKLQFAYDQSIEKADRIASLLKKAIQNDSDE